MAVKATKIERVYDGWGKYDIATFAMPNGDTVRREVEDHGRAACVLAYDPARKTALLVRQFRAPVFLTAGDEDFLEIIAGLADGEDPSEAAKREALEEAGLRVRTMEHVGMVWSMPGSSTERIDLYLAAYTAEDRVGPGGGLAQEQEETAPVELSLRDLAAMADSGRLNDLKSFALLQTLRLRRPDLFRT